MPISSFVIQFQPGDPDLHGWNWSGSLRVWSGGVASGLGFGFSTYEGFSNVVVFSSCDQRDSAWRLKSLAFNVF